MQKRMNKSVRKIEKEINRYDPEYYAWTGYGVYSINRVYSSYVY